VDDDEARWQALGQQLRVDCVRATAAAGSGHPPASLSAADLMAVLLDKYLRYDFAVPKHPCNDHLVFSKGHAAPLLYAMYKAAGAITDQELLTLRQFGSRLEGHPTPRLPWVDVATGSLGQGLPIAVGMALGAKRLEGIPSRVWVLCGDGEMAEGSMWEAFEHAAFEGLDNLTAIIDINGFGQHETMYGWGIGAFARRAQAFGWQAIEVDGHDPTGIDQAYGRAVATTGQPTVIVACTVKGKGIRAIQHRRSAYSKPLADPEAAIQELGGHLDLSVDVTRPEGDPTRRQFKRSEVQLPRYEVGSRVSLRQAYGEALAALGAAREDVVAVDADMKTPTCTHRFAEDHPGRFFQMHIAEQQMVATAVGLQVLGYVPFAATFAAFLSRAYDFVRMAAVSRANIRLVGSHPGVSIGFDGPSQMGLEDLAAFRAVHGSTVLYPSDANQTAQLVAHMADRSGISYLRLSRAELPVLYGPDERFEVGGSRTPRWSEHDDVTVAAAGITLHEALKAADLLAGEGIRVRVIDLYSIKPVDGRTLQTAARATAGRVITVEDHWPEGGLGDVVASSLAGSGGLLHLEKLAVSGMPGSGNPGQLLRAAGIDADAIARAAYALVG
jgi:transketolase